MICIDEFNRIVVFRQGQFGDTVIIFPLIEALNRLYPNTPIFYCTNHFKSDKYVQGDDVIRMSPHIKKIVTYNMEDSILKKCMKLKKDLCAGEKDLLIYLPYGTYKRWQIVRDWIFFKIINFKKMICFEEMWNWTYIYEKKNCELPKEPERMLEFVRSAGMPVQLPEHCSLKYDENWAEQKWMEWGFDKKKVIAICPGGKMQSKRWPIARYIEVCRRWHKRTGMAFVVVGGPEETDMAKEIVSHLSGYVFSACGATLKQTAALLSRVQAYCGNDTGSMHMAAVLGISCAAIFSSRELPKRWYPIGENHIVLRKKIDCENCNLEICYKTPPPCLDNISVEEVLEALTQIDKRKIKFENNMTSMQYAE